MTVDALEYLRAKDPVPHGSTAPPMEWVLARIESAGTKPARRRTVIPIMPALAVAATLSVVAAVIVLAVTHRSHAPAHVPPATQTAPAVHSVPPPTSLMPRGGMRGMLSIAGAAASGGHVVISFSQCQPCRAQGSGPGSATHAWQAITTDGGASWRVARASADLTMFDLAGADGWAEGAGPDRTARFFASHDGGRTWDVASSDASAPGGVGGVSIAGGEAWSLGSHCGGACAGSNAPPADVVLRAPASSSHLFETAGQPSLGDATNVNVVATSRDDAYVLTDDYGSSPKVATIAGSRLFATHDGGRTWRRLAAACPARTFGRLYAGGADALWALCTPMHGPSQLRRSTDGGGHWTMLASRPPSSVELQPASAHVAWATTADGKVFRTSDGGRTWTRVWFGGRLAATPPNAPPGLNRSWSADLTVESPTTATVIAEVTRGHVDGHAAQTDFVTYRTTDGGRTWHPTPVRLPAG